MEDALKYSLIPFASLLMLGSCAWYQRSVIQDEQNDGKSATISRANYDQLLAKYEELSKKYEQLKEGPPGTKGSLVDELQQGENFSQGSETETVNLFSSDSEAGLLKVPEDIESQVSLYRKGISLKSTNQGEATKIFQQLESLAISPIKVRSKYQIGDMLLSKGQYDLALQVFEDIINKYAESGIVLDALQGAVMSAEKLGLQTKKDQYHSMLVDVFGPSQDI